MDRALIDCTAKNRSFLNFSLLTVFENLKHFVEMSQTMFNVYLFEAKNRVFTVNMEY